MTNADSNNQPDVLRAAIESVADQLCVAVDGEFDFRVKVEGVDPSIEKLQMLVNFVLDAARRSVQAEQDLNEELRSAMTQVKESLSKAEAANQAKSDFLANMSHELRTPLTAILGFTDILKESAIPNQHDALSTVKRNAEQLLNIVSDILDLSKVESGEAQIIIGETETIPLLQEVTNGHLSAARKKGIDLSCCTRTPIPEIIHTDGLRIRQILTNLVGNAVKFTDQGYVRLEAGFQRRPVSTLIIDVIDSGMGISPQHQKQIFTAFAQADTSATRSFGGTGMGLTISRSFAQLLGGDVTIVRAKFGSGSVFRLQIPYNVDPLTRMVELDSTADEGIPESSKPAGAKEGKPLDQLSILLVEDGIDNQRLIKHILSKHGANVTTADNGQIAVDTVQAAATSPGFDVVIMDMQMPVMDGYTATKTLRSAGSTMPILALTAHAMAGDQEKCLNAGCTDYATKPINPRALVEKIATLAAANRSVSAAK